MTTNEIPIINYSEDNSKSKLIKNLSDPDITPEKSKLPSLKPKEQSISPNQE